MRIAACDTILTDTPNREPRGGDDRNVAQAGTHTTRVGPSVSLIRSLPPSWDFHEMRPPDFGFSSLDPPPSSVKTINVSSFAKVVPTTPPAGLTQ